MGTTHVKQVEENLSGKPYLKPEPRRLEFQGESLTLREWSERTGIHLSTLKTRLRAGWSIEDVLTRKTETQTREILRDKIYRFILKFKQENDGIPPTIPEIAEHFSCSSSNAYAILKQLEKAGLIFMGEKHAARGLRVEGGKWIPPKVR